MIAVLSATEHDYYAMPLPFAVESWNRIGVNCIVFIPEGDNPKLELAKDYCSAGTEFYTFSCEEKRIPTYSQVSRLFAAALPHLDPNTVLITGDSDMAVFSNFLWEVAPNSIIGVDLTPSDQYPICYLKMQVHFWRQYFGIHKSYQEHLSEIIDPIEGDNIRGNQWCLDQWLANKQLNDAPLYHINRAKPGTQFASRRADRDGWHFDIDDIIDAHLPRPLTEESNFQKVADLFHAKYPDAPLQWMYNFRNEYLNLLK